MRTTAYSILAAATIIIATQTTPALAYWTADLDAQAYEGALLNVLEMDCQAPLDENQRYKLASHRDNVAASDKYSNASFHYHAQLVVVPCADLAPLASELNEAP